MRVVVSFLAWWIVATVSHHGELTGGNDIAHEWDVRRGVLIKKLPTFLTYEQCSIACGSLGACYEEEGVWECVWECKSDFECPNGFVCGCLDRSRCSGSITGLLSKKLLPACRRWLGRGDEGLVLAVPGYRPGDRASLFGPAYCTEEYFLRLSILHVALPARYLVLELSTNKNYVLEYPVLRWKSEDVLLFCPPGGWRIEYFAPHPFVRVEISCDWRLDDNLKDGRDK